MGYKALRVACPHPDHKIEDKDHWMSVATLMVPDEIADIMEKGNIKLRYKPNHLPGVDYMVFPPKEWDDGGQGEAAKKKW